MCCSHQPAHDARMVWGHKLTMGIRYSNFPFSQWSKGYNTFYLVAYKSHVSWPLLKKSFMKKLHRPSWGPLSYCAKPLRCNWLLWEVSGISLNTEQSKSQLETEPFPGGLFHSCMLHTKLRRESSTSFFFHLNHGPVSNWHCRVLKPFLFTNSKHLGPTP